jgi:methionine aminopeptidase
MNISEDVCQDDIWNDYREAAKVHKEVRAHAKSIMRPGMKLVDLCGQVCFIFNLLIENV